MLISVLYVLLGFVSVLMGLAILLQEPKQAGLSGAFGLGGDSQMLGTSPASGIAKLTRLLAVIFFALCVGVGILAKEEGSSSMLEDDPSNPALTTQETAGVGDALGGDLAGDGGAVIEVVEPVTGDNTAAPAEGGAADAVPAETTGETDAGTDASAEDAGGAAADAAAEPATPAEEASTPTGGAGQR